MEFRSAFARDIWAGAKAHPDGKRFGWDSDDGPCCAVGGALRASGRRAEMAGRLNAMAMSVVAHRILAEVWPEAAIPVGNMFVNFVPLSEAVSVKHFGGQASREALAEWVESVFVADEARKAAEAAAETAEAAQARAAAGVEAVRA